MILYYDERLQARIAGNGLKKLVKAHNITMRDLGSKINISETLLYDISNCRAKLHRYQFFMICQGLGIEPIDTNEFFTFECPQEYGSKIVKHLLIFNNNNYHPRDGYLYHSIYEPAHIFVDRIYEKHWNQFLKEQQKYGHDSNYSRIYR